MNRPVPKLQGMQSKIAKNAKRNASHSRNSVSSGELHQKEGKERSSGFSTTSWIVYVGQTTGEMRKHNTSFRGHERATDQKL